jgi:hypothetical protein
MMAAVKVTVRTKILIGIAGATAAYVMFGSEDSQIAEAAKGAPGARTVTHKSSAPMQTHGQKRDAAQLLYSLTHRVADGDSAQSLFASRSWYIPPPPPPPPAVPTLTPAQEAALKVPVAPPLPFSFMGSYAAYGDTPVFFLTQGDRVFSVKVGDTLNDVYTVDSMTNGQLVMTYKPLKIQQLLTVGSTQ